MQKNNNRAEKFGDGLFETIRFHNGKPLWSIFHFERLALGMKQLKFDTSSFDYDFFCKLLEDIEISGDKDFRVRITFFREGQGLYTPEINTFTHFAEYASLATDKYELNSNGLSIGICEDVFITHSPISNLKTISALPYVLAGVEKKEKGWDDALILNQKGEVAEAVAANLFLVKESELFTPPLDSGCIAGVMRRNIINLAKLNSIPVYEKAISKEELYEADELFLTNAISGLRWVQYIKGIKKSYQHRLIANIVELLNKSI